MDGGAARCRALGGWRGKELSPSLRASKETSKLLVVQKKKKEKIKEKKGRNKYNVQMERRKVNASPDPKGAGGKHGLVQVLSFSNGGKKKEINNNFLKSACT